MSSGVSEPTLQGIPAEIRVKIYENLFADLTLDVAYTKPGDSEWTREKYEKNMPPYLAATAILSVNKQIRKEALPILEDNLTLIALDPYELEPAKKFLPGAKKLRVKDLDRPRAGAKAFRRYLPKVELITYVQMRDPWWRKSLECKTWEDVFEILKGRKDRLLVREFFKFMRTLAPEWLPDHRVLPGQSPCKVRFELPCLSICWPDTWGIELAYLYRLDLDIVNEKVDYRAINLGYDCSRADEWVPAENILILRDGLKRPALFRPENGEIRALLEADTRDEVFEDKRRKRKGKGKGVVLDYEKRGKYINHEETDIGAIKEVERQLADKGVLRRALTTAERCALTEDADMVTDALSALGLSKKSKR